MGAAERQRAGRPAANWSGDGWVIVLCASQHSLWDAVLPPLLAACVTGAAVLLAARRAAEGVRSSIQAQRKAADMALQQRWEADRQPAWWSRAEFALTQVANSENSLAVQSGLGTLFELQTRPAADGDELLLRRIMALLAADPEKVDLRRLGVRAQTVADGE